MIELLSSPATIALAAIIFDAILGETKRLHPLVGFGRYADWLESRLNRSPAATPPSAFRLQRQGAIALSLAIGPWLFLVWQLQQGKLVAHASPDWLQIVLMTLILYFCLGMRSLFEHCSAVGTALSGQNIEQARSRTSYLVSRETAAMSEDEMLKSTLESLLENGNDAIFATLFWFFVLGPSGAVLHRLVNTLDAMWGYRNERFQHFGWAAARLDDMLAWLPARLCALSYLLFSGLSPRQICQCLALSREQARHSESPNGGPVMAAGACALGIVLGGGARYFGKWKDKPMLGHGTRPRPRHIEAAIRLIRRGVFAWLIVAWAIVVLLISLTRGGNVF